MYKVLVTGASQGIGLAIAGHFRSKGYEVITCSRKGPASVQCDVTDREQVEAMKKSIGPVDILINNVGGVVTAPFLKVSEETWDWHFQVNVKSVFHCTQAFLPDMLARKWGRIVNIASTAGKIGGRYIAAYVAAKHAVVGMTRSLALELGDQGITVNAVCPSFVDTPMLRQSAETVAQKTKKSVDEIMDQFRKRNPQQKLIEVQDIARTVLFLVETPGVNGQAISICGGETA